MDALIKLFLPPRSGTSVCAHRKCANLLAYELELPWCGTKLKWQLLRDLARPDLPPDFVLLGSAAAGFNPLLLNGGSGGNDADADADARQLLATWRPGAPAAEARATASVVAALLRAFCGAQRRRLAAVGDTRVSFELGMLDEGGGAELLLVDDERDPAGRRACFGVPLKGVDLSCAAPLRAYQRRAGCGYGGGGGGGSGSGTAAAASTAASPQPEQSLGIADESDPLALAAAAGPPGTTSEAAAAGGDGDGDNSSGFYLHIAFPIGKGTSASAGPGLSLEAPPWFAAAALPPLPLPPWDPQAPLAEYAHSVSERLRQHLATHCAAAAAKYQLVDELAALFGAPLEVRMAAAAPGAPAGVSPAASTAPAYSYSAAVAGVPLTGSGAGIGSGAGSGASGGGPAACAAVFNVLYDGQPLLLFVEISPRFPEEQPALALQSVRRAGADGCAAYATYPWSPRWAVDEMAARIFNFVREEAANAAARLHGGGGSGGAAA